MSSESSTAFFGILVVHCGKITMGGFILFRAAKYRPGLDY